MLVLLILIQASIVLAQTPRPCFSPYTKMAFPQILGGSNISHSGASDTTQYHCMVYDSARQKVIVGGMSMAQGDLVVSRPSPIMVQYDEMTGDIDWHSQIQVGGSMHAEQFTLCAIQEGGGAYTIALSDNPGFGIFLYSKNTGQLESAFYQTSLSVQQSTRKPIGVTMFADGTIYLATDEVSVLMLSVLRYSSFTITNLLSVSFSSSTQLINAGSSLLSPLTGTTDTAFYVAGSLNKQVSLFKISGNFTNWVVSIKDSIGVSPNPWLKTIDTFNVTSTSLVHFGCAENLGFSYNDVGFIFLEETLGLVPSSGKTYYVYVSTKGRCINTRTNATHGRFLIHKESDAIFTATIHYSSTNSSLSLQKFSLNAGATLATFVKIGLIYKSDWSGILYGGSINKIKNTTYSPQVAFLMSLPFSSSLVPSLAQPVFVSINNYLNPYFPIVAPSTIPQLYYQNVTTLGTYTTTTSQINYIKDPLVTSTLLNNLTVVKLPDEFYTSKPMGTLSYGTQTIPSTVNYTISTPKMSLSFSNFTYSMNCPDIIWKYTAVIPQLTNTYANFSETSSGGRFDIQTNDTSLNGTQFIMYIGTVGAQYTLINSFTLNLILPPPIQPPLNSTSVPTNSTSPLNTTSNATNSTTPSNTTSSPNSTLSNTTTTSTTTTSNTTTSNTASSPNNTTTNSTLPDAKITCSFLSPPQSYFLVLLKAQLQYPFPAWNCTGQLLLSQLTGAPLPSFITYDQTTIRVRPMTLGQSGRYQLIAQMLINGVAASDKYMMVVDVLGNQTSEQSQLGQLPPNVTQSNSTQPNGGTNATQIKGQNGQSVGTNKQVISIKIKEISMNGKVVIAFNTRMLIPADYQNFQQEVLEIYVNDRSVKVQNWTMTDFSEQSMQVQLYFDNPQDLSTLQEPDILTIKVKDNLKFLTMNTQQPINQGFQCSKQIPMQFRSQSEIAVLQSIAQTITSSATTGIVGVMALNLILTIALQQLWGLINTLQFILHIPLFSIPLPPNLMTFFKAIFNVITFDFYDTNPKIQKIFGLKEDSDYPAYNDRFDMLGYSTSNTLYNVGMPIFFILFYLTMLAVYLMILKLPWKVSKWLKEKMQPKVLWDVPIRFVMELALEGVISSIVNIKSYVDKEQSIDSLGEIMTVLLSVAMIVLNIIFATIVTNLLIKNRGDLESNEYLSKYFGEFVETQRTIWTGQLYYHAIFVLRRFLMITIIFALEDTASLQVLAFFVMNLSYLLYVIRYKPLHEQWRFEIFNECTTLLMSALTFFFTDFVDSSSIKYYIGGYLFIVVFCTNVAVNMLSILVSSAISAYKQVRQKIRVCRYKIKRSQNYKEEAAKIDVVDQKILRRKRSMKRKRGGIKIDLSSETRIGIKQIIQNTYNLSPQQQGGEHPGASSRLFVIQEEFNESSPVQRTKQQSIDETNKSRLRSIISNVAASNTGSSRYLNQQHRIEDYDTSPQIDWGEIDTPFQHRQGRNQQENFDHTPLNEGGVQANSGFSLQLQNCVTTSNTDQNQLQSHNKLYQFNKRSQSQTRAMEKGDLSGKGQLSSSRRGLLNPGAEEFTPKQFLVDSQQLFQKINYVNATQKKHYQNQNQQHSVKNHRGDQSSVDLSSRPDYHDFQNEPTPQFKKNYQEPQDSNSTASFIDIAREHKMQLMSQIPQHYFKTRRISQPVEMSNESRNNSNERNDLESNMHQILNSSPDYVGSPEPLKSGQQAKDTNLIFSTFSHNQQEQTKKSVLKRYFKKEE